MLVGLLAVGFGHHHQGQFNDHGSRVDTHISYYLFGVVSVDVERVYRGFMNCCAVY